MAKLRGPLFSIDARGSLAKTIHFMKTPFGHKACRYTIPIDRKSPEQLAHRALFSMAVMGWQGLTPAEKAVYDTYVKDHNLHMSGYNYFCSVYSIPSGPPALIPVSDSLSLWYKFDEGSGDTLHDSIGSNHATKGGTGGSWVDGLLNGAFNFAGSARFRAPAPAVSARPFTFEVWLKMPASGSDRVILHNNDINTSSWENPLVQYYPSQGGFHYAMGPGSCYVFNSYTPDNVNFTQLCFIYTSDGYLHCYNNGVLTDHIYGGQPFTTAFHAEEFILGAGHWAPDTWGRYFIGSVCCLRVYTKALTVDEILQNYDYETQ